MKQLLVSLVLILNISVLKAQVANFDTIDARFDSPSNAYRIIHYHMNGVMNSKTLDTALTYGIGGIQTRISLNNYLQNESSWTSTEAFIDSAKARGMQVWIHDEAGYPSGAAAGLVVEGFPEYEVRGLIRIDTAGTGTGSIVLKLPDDSMFIRANLYNVVGGEVDFSSAQEVTITGDSVQTNGLTGDWQLSVFGEMILDTNTQAQSTMAQFGQTGHYPSLLNKDACARFVEVTHQNYGNHFKNIGEQVDVFYTGETNLMSTHWQYDGSKAPHKYIPWEQTMIDSFQTMHGYDLLPHLDALFRGISNEAQTVRLHYYQTIAELVAKNYGGQITAWCKANGVRSMAHPLLEEHLICHVMYYGDMLNYLRQFHISGCDLHIGRKDNNHWIYWMGKYVSSAAYLDDKDSTTIMGLLDPIIGFGKSDLTPEIPIMKRTINMNMLCGINQFTSYMPYTSATDGYTPTEYKHFNEYVSRIGMMLRGARNEAPIAMYYPIKTFQSSYKASDENHSAIMGKTAFKSKQNIIDNLAQEILENGLDFNFVTDDVLLQSIIDDGKLIIGTHIYAQLVMPATGVIPLEVLMKIQTIEAAGIPVHWVGQIPGLGQTMAEHDSVKSIAPTLTLNNSPLSNLLEIKQNNYSIDFSSSSGKLSMSRFRKEGKRIYFVVNDDSLQITLTATSTNVDSVKIYNPVDGSTHMASLPLSENIGGYESLLIVESNVNDSTLGIGDVKRSSLNQIKVYPNPTKDVINIEVANTLIGSTLDIVDSTGRIIERKKIKKEAFTLNTSKYISGVYFVRIEGASTTKFIKE